MKGFKFRLQSVLDARQKKLEDCQLNFAKAKNRLHRENLVLSNFIKVLDETILSLKETLNSGGIDNTIIFVHQNYIITTKESIKKQKVVIEIAEKELEEKNQLMLEALKAKKVMEKLKEKALEEFKENINRHEMLIIDEIATCRYAKRG
ncbi:MAG: flagellar export protein FliJ [Candidatus Melainabacteria bacterium GWA2_34_9]|nr:MAG: flagellar export protein FliJ [Candidatus Melainabacteria bacterium GWA2_34_9]